MTDEAEGKGAAPPLKAHLESDRFVDDEEVAADVADSQSKSSAEAVDKGVSASHKVREYPLRETRISLPAFLNVCGESGHGFTPEMRFNWFSSIFGLAFLWGLAAYCMANPAAANAKLGSWLSVVTKYFTWFFIAANPVLTFFVVWLAFRYGHLKLGDKNAKPEFSDVSYFAMIFSAGIGVGLFFFGVSEPLWHQNSHYYSNPGYRSQDEIDQWALLITMYHWGFAAWSPYLTVAIAAGLATYKFGLPMTMRSSFYPILGAYTWGWMGDLIDGFSIVMTVAGVCTSLGLGTIQIVTGLQRLGWVDADLEDPRGVYIAVIWIITAGATLSVVSGIHMGIKTLAIVAFSLGMLVLFISFVMEKTYYLLNLTVQTTGVYLQWSIFQIPFWTDAFGSLQPGEGRAIDDKASATWWIGAWTVFYMAWWVAWACFVGIFIARISKNRSLRQIIISVFLAPTAYGLIWFSIMGGIGLRQQRQAAELQVLGEEYYGDAEYYHDGSSRPCYDVPQEDVVVNGTTIFTNTLPGVTPVCEFDSSSSSSSWFNVMYSFSYPGGDFGGFGPFLSGFSIFALAIYFITSSDSGSLVVDILASNGAMKHHWIQRVFWAFTEGAVATALLVAGGSDALGALQAASIVFGLPYNLFLFIMCASIVRMCQVIESEQLEDSGIVDADIMLPEKTWSLPVFGGIFNIFEFMVSLGNVHPARKSKGMDLPSQEHVVGFFKNLFLPFVTLHSIYSTVDTKNQHVRTNAISTFFYFALFLAMIALFVCGVINHGFVALGWACFFTNACILTSLRLHVREKLAIRGNIIWDFLASSFFYPQVLTQMDLQLKEEKIGDAHSD